VIGLIALALTTFADRPAKAQTACVRPEDLTMARSIELPKGRWLDDNHRRIVELIRRRGAGSPGYDPCRRPLAVFDWDNTVLAGDIGDQAFNTGAETGFFKQSPGLLEPLPEANAKALKGAWSEKTLEARYQFHRAYLDLCAAKGNAVCFPWLTQLFWGHDTVELESFASKLIATELEREPGPERIDGPGEPIVISRGVRVRPEMESLIRALDAAGFDVFVITASPEWLVQVFAPKVGVPRENVMGMRTTSTLSGTNTSKIEPPSTYRAGKVAAIRTRIPPGGRVPVLAVGDTETDWEMLDEATDLSVLMDHDHPGLRKHGEARGWVIQPAFEGLSAPVHR
jgi:phosphoserine phosphatase